LNSFRAVPHTDARFTPYHAIRRSLPKRVRGSTVVVIGVGVGGLGHMTVQILAATTAAKIIIGSSDNSSPTERLGPSRGMSIVNSMNN
jgi:alcohol dehydrogenase, propanol-preferring